ncbi:MAG: IS200/IS605 family transposase [Bacteroidetes bacterium]|nr:IS200/IS605 family transposase [Bacteroidota bacterium]
MTATYSQIFIHVVFSVKNKKSLLPPENLEEVFEYISGIIRKKGQKPVIVGGVQNHVHVLIGMKPGVTVSALVRDIKNNSANFINQKDWIREKFSWQNGFGAFSYGSSQVEKVYEYIKNQAQYHKTKTFREEYVLFLERYNVEYQEKEIPVLSE